MDLEILFQEIGKREVVLVGHYEDIQKFNEFTKRIKISIFPRKISRITPNIF